MKVSSTPLPDARVVHLDLLGDERGFFVERFTGPAFEEAGLPTSFAQVNHSRSAPGVLRGIHYQYDPPQGKLVGVTRGRVLDVAVDLRPDSPTFGRHHAVELSDMNGMLFWVPAGFGHAFCVLGDDTADLLYMVDALYNPKGESGVAWDDPDLGIAWPVAAPTLSKRDVALPSFRQYAADPIRWNQLRD